MKASAENTLPNMADLFASPEKKYGASPSALSAEEVAAMQNFYVTSLRPNARIIPSSTRREPRRSPDAFSKFPTVQEEEQRPQINLAFLDSPESVRNAADRSPESTSLSRSLLDRLRSPMSPRSNMQRFLDMLDLAGPVPYLGEDPNFDEVQAEAIDDVVRMDIAGTQSSNARAFSLSLLDAESIGAVNKSASQASTALAARSESVASIIGEDIGSVARIGSRDTKSISEEVSRISLQAEAIRNIDRIDFARTQSSASRSSILPELKSDLIDNINKIQFSKTRSVAANSSSATHIRSDPISNIHKIPSAVSKVVILDQSIFSINSEIIPHVDKIQSKVSKAVLSKSSNVTCAKAEEISKVPAIVASTTSSANITPSVPLGLIAEPMGRVQKLPIATSEPIASKASTSSSIVAVPIVDIAVVPSAVSKTNASKPSSISEIKAEAIAIVGKMPQNNTERSNEKPSILKLLGAEAVGDIVPLVSSPTKTSLAKPSTLTTVKAESIPDVAKVKSLDTESSNISAETIYSGSYSSYSEWPPENYNSSGGGESHCPPNCGPGIDLKKPIKMASGNGFGNAFGSIGGAIDLRLFGRGVGIAAGEGKKIEKGFWEKWLHSYTEQTTQGKKDPGYNMRQKGVATGLDAEVRDNLTLGVAYTNMFSSSSSKEILHDTEKARLQIASLYGEYNPSERSMFKAKLHYGQAKINHKIDAPMLKSKGDTKGKLWKASIDAIYGYNYKDLIISPKISGIYDSFHIDAFDQKTSNGKIYIPNRKGHKFAAAIGVGVKKEYKVKQINIVPKIHFNVNQVLYKNEESPELDFSSGEAVVNLFKLGNNDRTTYNVGGYINMNRSEMFEIGVGYDHYFRKGYKNHSSYVSMFLRF